MKVLVTTQHRGVFVGELAEGQDITARSMTLLNARMAIYWGTTKGVMELAEVGPNATSKVSSKADIPMLHDITSVIAVTEAAWAKWEKY